MQKYWVMDAYKMQDFNTPKMCTTDADQNVITQKKNIPT